MNRVKIIATIALSIILLGCIIPGCAVQAANVNKAKNIDTIDGVIGAADDFISGAKTDNTIEQKGLQNTIDLIYNILLAIGMVVAVVEGIVLGIQFMTASTEGKAEVKEKLIPYVVGCVVIFGAFGIWKLVMVLIGTF